MNKTKLQKKKPVTKPKPKKPTVKKVTKVDVLPAGRIPLKWFKANASNPRSISKEAFELLKNSIQRDPDIMELRPIVYDEDKTILGGNQRFRALKALGYDEIPESWVKDGSKLSAAAKRRFILIDNQPKGMSGEFDYEILSNEYDVGELIDVGFSTKDLGLDLSSLDPSGDESGEDKEKELKCPKCGHRWVEV